MSKFFAFLVIFTLTLMIATSSLSLPTSKISDELNSSTSKASDELNSSELESATNSTSKASDELNSSELESSTPHGKLISNKSAFTYFWLASEKDHNSTEKVQIKNCKKKTIATVNRDFANEMKTEGSGISNSGDVFNFDDCSCGSTFNCFVKLDKKKFPFGLSADGNALRPFITVAANDIPAGKLLYIPALRGLTLPGKKRHNGCVKVEDTGDSFHGKHIDWFVPSESIYEDLDNKKEISNVQVFDGTSSDGKKCNLQTYVV